MGHGWCVCITIIEAAPVGPFAKIGRHDAKWQSSVFQMMGVFAEFERAMIQERARAGLARAKL